VLEGRSSSALHFSSRVQCRRASSRRVHRQGGLVQHHQACCVNKETNGVSYVDESSYRTKCGTSKCVHLPRVEIQVCWRREFAKVLCQEESRPSIGTFGATCQPTNHRVCSCRVGVRGAFKQGGCPVDRAHDIGFVAVEGPDPILTRSWYLLLEIMSTTMAGSKLEIRSLSEAEEKEFVSDLADGLKCGTKATLASPRRGSRRTSTDECVRHWDLSR